MFCSIPLLLRFSTTPPFSWGDTLYRKTIMSVRTCIRVHY